MKTRAISELKPPQPTMWVRDSAILIPVPDLASTTFYDVELRRVDTPLKLLAWVDHLTPKPWMDKARLREFIRVAATAHGFTIPHEL